jgi:hypothetical protein
MVARVIPIRPVASVPPDPPHGTLSEIHPPHGLALESGCDSGNCSKRGALWRFLGKEDPMGPMWIVVCRACSKKP